MKKKLVGMLATATLLTMALAGNVQAAEIRSVGPDGEAAVDASTIELTDDQIAQIKEGGYTAAICLHYGGNDWSTSQQKGLEDTFGELGIEIVAVTDANFSAETQVSNIETVMAKKPDILVSIPTDATATADAYKQAAAAGIKIVFMDQRADGLEAGKDYVSVVSADNYGNGYASGTVLGDALGGKGKVTLEVHGTKGSISWCYERLNELNVCYGMEDQDGERGFKTIYTGPANPHGDVTWNIPGMNIGYGELKAIEMYEFGKAIVEGYQPSTNFGVGYRLDRVCDAILESNETGSWVKVK